MENTANLTDGTWREMLATLHDRAGEAIEKCWAAPSLEAQLELMAAEAPTLSDAIKAVGSHCRQRLSEDPESGQGVFYFYLINYEWAEEAKAFLLLWRDTLFELQKGVLIRKDGLASEEKLQKLRAAAKGKLLEAAQEWKDFIENASKEGVRGRPARKRRINQWRLQNNPWPVYEKQLTQLAQQCGQLLEQFRKMEKSAAVFEELRRQAHRLGGACQDEFAEARATIEQAVALFSKQEGGEELKPGKAAARLEALSSQVQLSNNLKALSVTLERSLEALPEKIQIAIDTRGGLVEQLDLNLRKRSLQWLESEVLPDLYKGRELAEATNEDLRMALANVRNRAILLANEPEEREKRQSGLLQPIEGFRNRLLEANEELRALLGQIRSRLDTHFKLCLVYDRSKPFLQVPLQSSLNQFSLERYAWLGYLQRWSYAQAQAFRRLRKAAEREENLSQSEKLVRYIQSRKISPDISQYAAIFQASGYIGESFWVGRNDEMQHIRNIINNWEKGFRGAVLVSGMRFSGKSFFGEMAAHRFFGNRTIRLSPETAIEVQGRKLDVGYDLQEALDFIRKNTLNQKPLVWIDDLELWWSPNIPLNQNVRALRQHIDEHSSSIFFMVSMSNNLRAHLEQLHRIGSVFQAELNMDYMPASAVREAIMIRHGATHMKLVNKQSQEATPQQFNQAARRVHGATAGNIGESLYRWALSVRRVDNNTVMIAPKIDYTLPDFAGSDAAMLLCYIIMQKQTKEYHLRKVLGPPFAEKYLNILRRLLSVGLLNRQSDGWLEVNNVVANALGGLLERKNYLKYHQWKQ